MAVGNLSNQAPKGDTYVNYYLKVPQETNEKILKLTHQPSALKDSTQAFTVRGELFKRTYLVDFHEGEAVCAYRSDGNQWVRGLGNIHKEGDTCKALKAYVNNKMAQYRENENVNSQLRDFHDNLSYGDPVYQPATPSPDAQSIHRKMYQPLASSSSSGDSSPESKDKWVKVPRDVHWSKATKFTGGEAKVREQEFTSAIAPMTGEKMPPMDWEVVDDPRDNAVELPNPCADPMDSLFLQDSVVAPMPNHSMTHLYTPTLRVKAEKV